jgi:DNA primase large subunit
MAADLNTKANRRKLRELSGVAYTRELSAELAKLERDFVQWRSGEIDPFELSDRIHRFHDGISRNLYVLYRDLPASHSVARAVVLQLLQETEVPSEILSALEPAIGFYREQSDEPDGEAPDPND